MEIKNTIISTDYKSTLASDYKPELVGKIIHYGQNLDDWEGLKFIIKFFINTIILLNNYH
jgi:hypothetical protein